MAIEQRPCHISFASFYVAQHLSKTDVIVYNIKFDRTQLSAKLSNVGNELFWIFNN